MYKIGKSCIIDKKRGDIMKKVALVTGGSRGIGKAIVAQFAKAGYDVIVNYINDKEKAFILKQELENKYLVHVLLVRADVSNEKEVKSMVEEIMATYGRIDVLVNNAGIVIDKEFVDRTVQDFEKTFSTNLIGPFLVSKYVGEVMVENRGVKSLIFPVQMVLMLFFRLVLIMMPQKLHLSI